MDLLIVLKHEYRRTLRPLVGVWRSKGSIVRFHYYDSIIPSAKQLTGLASGSDAVILFYKSKRAPSTLLDSPFLMYKKKKILASLVPVSNEEALRNFVATAVAVHQRTAAIRSVASLLSQRLPRYLKVTGKIVSELNDKKKIQAYKWTSDLVYPGDLLFTINQGPGLVIYMGHGRSYGWCGYSGVRLHHLCHFRNKPAAAMLSLCCWTAGRQRTQRSFCEGLISEGLSASALGAVRPTLFADNTRWAINISSAIQNGVFTVGELILNSCPVNTNAIKSYRLFGDPTVPLAADRQFFKFAKQLNKYE